AFWCELSSIASGRVAVDVRGVVRRLGGVEAALEVPQQIFKGFEANGQADSAAADARGYELLLTQLAVRRTGRVNDQALGVAHVGQMAPQAKRGDEPLAGRAPTADIEREHGTGPPGQIFFNQRPVWAVRQ